MTFERSTDWEVIKAIATHPKVWDAISDDFTPSKDIWEPTQHEAIWYVLVKDEAELLGMFTFVPENAICWKVHTCLLPCAYGARARQAARELTEWIWRNTPCLRVITDVPSCNRIALRFAEQVDFTRYGTNPHSYMKGGMLQDQILLGISRPEAPCH